MGVLIAIRHHACLKIDLSARGGSSSGSRLSPEGTAMTDAQQFEEMKVLAKGAGIVIPPSFAAGVLTNLTLLRRHAAIVGQADPVDLDPAELLIP